MTNMAPTLDRSIARVTLIALVLIRFVSPWEILREILMLSVYADFHVCILLASRRFSRSAHYP